MSVILSVSLLLRILATLWSLSQLWRLRDRRIVFLTIILVLMTGRQIMTLFHGFSSRTEFTLDMTANLDELPGLVVSLMIFVIVLRLQDMFPSPAETVKTTRASGGQLLLPAFAIGLGAIALAVVIAFFAYQHSRDAIRQTVAGQNLALGRTVSNAAMQQLKQSHQIDRNAALASLQQVWDEAESPFEKTYMCVIGPAGKLDLHSLKPEMKGTDVSSVVVSEKTGQTVMQLLNSQASWRGQNTNFRGIRQLVGYHYEPSINSLVAIHIPAKIVDAGFRTAVAPWIGSMALVGGLLLPCSLALLFRSSHQANSWAVRNLTALAESEEKHRRLVENSPFCVHEITSGGKLSSMNEAGLRMMGVSDESDVCGTDYLSVVSPMDRPRVNQLLLQSLDGATNHFDFESTTGQFFHSCFVPLTNNDGTVQQIMGITQDFTERKAAEERLRSSESRFRAIFEQAAVGVARIDSSTGRFIEINDRYCDIVGYSQEEMLTLDFATITHADDLQADLNFMSQLIAGEISEFTLEKRYLKKDDSVVWVNLTVSPMWNADETTTTHIAIVEDITDRKKAEGALKLSEQRYRYFVEQTEEGFYRIDFSPPIPVNQSEDELIQQMYERGSIVECNKIFADMYGHDSAAEMTGTRLVELHGGCDDPENVQAMREFIRHDFRQLNVETTKFRSDRQAIHLTNNSVGVVEDDLYLSCWGTQRDITEQKRIEHALMESERRFRSIFELAAVGLAQLNSISGVILKVNRRYCQIVGVPAEQLIGRTWMTLTPADDLTADLAKMERLRAGDIRQFSIEKRLKRPNASPVDINLSVSAMWQPGEKPSTHIAIVEDITARKRAEDELQRIHDEMAHVSRLNIMTEMAAGVAHELNQPLSAIANYASACVNQLDQTSDLTDPDALEYLESISELAHHSGNVIRRLRDFTQSRPTRKQEADINELIRGTVEMLQFEVRKAQILVELDLPDSELNAHVDPVQIRQVIVNLVKNAIDAMLLTASDERILAITASRTANAVEIRVSDRGGGIPRDQIEQLFEPFSSGKSHGTGIGLSISSRILGAHQGSLDAWNNDGAGATFRCTLPAGKNLSE